MDDVYLCHHCGKIFYKLSTLESHVKWKHTEKTSEFMCEQCGRTFQKKFNLDKHIISGVHFIEESVNCALCEHRAVNRKIMSQHYEKFHKIALNEKNKYFRSADEFYHWKSEFENNTKARFVKLSSSRKRKNGFIRSSYFCHRDGNFVSKGRNLRTLKLKGSNKINAHCPAKMEVDFGENIVIVSYIDLHLGHDLDVTRLSLDPADKAFIAEKLAMQVPFEKILEEINAPRDKEMSEVKRVNLITRKDLWNIVDAFKINPKSVVYSKSRGRRKKINFPIKEPRRNPVNYRIIKPKPDPKNSEIIYTVDNNISNDHVLTLNQQGKLCTFVSHDESSENSPQYALISDENDGGDGTCLIINANGELESISGHRVFCTEEGEIQIIQDEEELVFEEKVSTVLEETSNLGQIFVVQEDKKVNLEEFTNVNKEISRKKKPKINAKEVSNTVVKKGFNNRVSDTNNLMELELINDAIDGTVKQEIVMEEEVFGDNSHFEFLMVDGTEGIVSDEYVIISTEEELNNSNLVSLSDSQQEVKNILTNDVLQLKEEVLTEDSVVEEVVENVNHEEEQFVEITGENELLWDENGQVLHETVDNNIVVSNDYEFQVLSKNTSTIDR